MKAKTVSKSDNGNSTSGLSKVGRVFIIQQPRPKSDGWVPNFEPATQFGALHYIFDAGDRAYADPRAAAAKAFAKLFDFDDNVDFLLATGFGDPTCRDVVVDLMARMGHQPRYLNWSRGKGLDGEWTNEVGYYIPIEVGKAVAEFLTTQPRK